MGLTHWDDPSDVTFLMDWYLGDDPSDVTFNVPANDQDNDAAPGTNGGDSASMGGPNRWTSAGAWAVAWLAAVAGGAML